ncbi:MAG: hypothetical protein EOQ69_14870 [Mesorhizobium sp.]|uniref:hypothetical protein n=1 Tax=Mesorhizobium sp. TaxID=1871066 RepID=UPI000FE38C51|nr:hypothetical protein [Mesorhizobium sp.]RWA75706.1 MAG: hypothetical protein EOQ28_08670 [Mesorhizobium sp.]RWB99751.1 MAG: hypothetical protein EOQ57_18520 [Mesorhizobium sp.]RWG82824.1 MAG: hypothetical protein EOQ69_14870 [Mesorhizobium sp.]RWK21881.1 MAG: hypothetical protein EOR43_18475 [Mesorhizobium sp.]RWK29884.1 MAG: hypothetical protein EOR44_18425 [Mesorhizobium sp.]
MVPKSIVSASLAVLGGLIFCSGAEASDFACWQPNKALLAANESGGDYWTKERRDRAVPENDGGAITAPEPGKLAATRVDVTQTPFKYGGKLFYTRDGVDYTASAQFVAEDNVLLAAAHSMWRGDKHAVNVVFYRAYEDGEGTRFVVDQAAVLTDWIPISPNPPSAEKSALDYAALRTTASSDAGKFVLSKDGTFTAVKMMGYPGNFGDGNYMYKQDSTKLAQVGGSYLAAPTEFGTGASGGAWFVPDNSIVSVVSAQIMQGKTLAMTGPAFTDTTEAMIAFVKGGCK